MVEEATRAIYRILATDEDDVREPLKRLKVNTDTLPMGVLPLHFQMGVVGGVPYASDLAVVTPDEFSEIIIGSLSPPAQWRLGKIIENPAVGAESLSCRPRLLTVSASLMTANIPGRAAWELWSSQRSTLSRY